MPILNRNNSNWSFEERRKINENWDTLENISNSFVNANNNIGGELEELRNATQQNASRTTQALQTANQAKEQITTVSEVANSATDSALEANRNSNLANSKADSAVDSANAAEQTAQYVQSQLDNIVSEGDSNPEVVQARGDFDNLRMRLDEQNDSLVQQLTNVSKDLVGRGVNVLLNGVTGDGVTDDGPALQALINANTYVVIPTPPVSYRTTIEIVIPSNRTIQFFGDNHWNVLDGRTVRIFYDGPRDLTKAIFRASRSPVGTDPELSISNTKIIGGCVLDGNGLIGYGFYAAYATNESNFDRITAIKTLVDGIRIEKSWYCAYTNLTARGNFGNGMTIGRSYWGGVNGCVVNNLRAHSNGQDRTWSEENLYSGYGIGLYLGAGATAFNVTSESNYGPGLLYSTGSGAVTKVDTIYLERNGIGAREDGKTNRNWGLVVVGSANGRVNSVENIYLARAVGDPEVQSIWITGNRTTLPLELKNIAFGQHLRAEWDNYKLTGNIDYGISQYIQGSLPLEVAGILPSTLTTVYVRSNGSDTNDGRTANTAFLTIGKALQVVKNIATVNTINCADSNAVFGNIDLQGVNKVITIEGSNTGSISGSVNGSNGLIINNSKDLVNINNFALISRLNATNCSNVRVSNCTIGHVDSAFAGSMEIRNSKVYLENCTLSGTAAINGTKNGPRLYNSTLNLKTVTFTGYSANRYLSLSEGSTVTLDTSDGALQNVTWSDNTGFVIGGNRMRNPLGYVTFA